MKFKFNNFLENISERISDTVSSVSEYTKNEIIPAVNDMATNISEKTSQVTKTIKYNAQELSDNVTARTREWSLNGKADNIPTKYQVIVKSSLVAAAGIGPLGVMGVAADALAIATVWTSMFVAIRNNSNSSFGNDPSRIAKGVATGIVKYYIACKLATYTCFLIPGAGIFAGMSVSSICNIYFTYNFASIIIELMDTKPLYSDDDIIDEIISLLKKTPTSAEIKEIVYIYSD